MDIHTHILPGVDDGAASMEETLRMLEQAYEEGVRVILATPHYGKWNPDYDRKKTEAICRQVQQNLASLHSDMKLFLGNEIYYGPGVIDDLRAGRAATLGGTDYVLVEFSTEEEYAEIYKGMRSLVTAGYRPILAHIERYRHLRREWDRVRELVENGVYIQVNARSFLGGRFDKRTSWCLKLFEQDLIHFIASDCHNCESRAPIFQTAVEKLLSCGSEEAVKRIVHTNVIQLSKNNYI